MTRDEKPMTCEEFQAQIPELLNADTEIDLHEHPRRCDLCRALIHDLYQIQTEVLRSEYPSWIFRYKPPSK